MRSCSYKWLNETSFSLLVINFIHEMIKVSNFQLLIWKIMRVPGEGSEPTSCVRNSCLLCPQDYRIKWHSQKTYGIMIKLIIDAKSIVFTYSIHEYSWMFQFEKFNFISKKLANLLIIFQTGFVVSPNINLKIWKQLIQCIINSKYYIIKCKSILGQFLLQCILEPCIVNLILACCQYF